MATSHHVPARRPAASTDRVVVYAAATIVSTSSASGLLKRNMSTATGVAASRAPAASAVRGPDQRRTVRYSRPTAPTPMSACGASIDQEPKPAIRPDSAMTHSEAGGLSTVMSPGASRAPKSQAFGDCVPAWTAAA